MRKSIACLAVSLLVAACQTPSTRTPAARSELIDGMVKITTTACATELERKNSEKDFLKPFTGSPREICECTFRKFFGDMNDVELDRFIDASIKYGDKLQEMEPWNKDSVAAMVGCMAKYTPDLATASGVTAVRLFP